MRVIIKSSGEPCGTTVTTEDGRDLSAFCSGLSFGHEAGALPQLNIHLGLIPVEIEGVACMVGPDGREIRRIEYADGTYAQFSAAPPKPETVEFTPLGTGRTRKFRVGSTS